MGKTKLGLPQLNISHFLRAYQEHTCLWDVRNENYNKPFFRNLALQDLSNKYSLTPDQVRRKIHAVRSTYNQIRMKALESSKKPFKPLLNWYKDAAFLDNVITLRKPRDYDTSKLMDQRHSVRSTSTSAMYKEEDENQTNADDGAVYINQDETNAVMYEGADLGEVVQEDSDPLDEFQTIEEDDYVEVEQPIVRDTTEKDEFGLFSDFLASQLRSLPLVCSIQLMSKIQTLVTDVRLKTHLNRQRK